MKNRIVRDKMLQASHMTELFSHIMAIMDGVENEMLFEEIVSMIYCDEMNEVAIKLHCIANLIVKVKAEKGKC